MDKNVLSEITPNRKRKRDYEKTVEIKNGISNAAFSSTPKITGRRRLIPTNKENVIPFNSCMEIKSIAELVEKQKNKTSIEKATPVNPYEVQRKPPKKKKREAAIEESCFENPALNLNVPEKQFNPFEVIRDVNKNQEDKRKCFVNPALDIKCQDAVLMRNPFEIERTETKTEYNQASNIGYENLGLESFQPTSLKIGIPFKPTVGCRIDFNNIPLAELTPSKLLLNEKLVFSPVSTNIALPKRSLDAISEESSSVSIGKELDRYQLELENSINEAKMRKNDAATENGVMDKERIYQLQFKVEKRISLTTKLSDIAENEEFEIQNKEEIQLTELEMETKPNLEKSLKEYPKIELLSKKVDEPMNAETPEDLCADNSNAGFNFDSDEDFKVDFKTPAPFVRAYRRDEPKSISKESINTKNSLKSSTENVAVSKKEKSVKNLIRKSLRKIIPNNNHNHQQDKSQNDLTYPTETELIKETEKKQCTLTSHLMSSIRQSLRRKPKEEIKISEFNTPLAEISIIDTSERKMKLKSCVTQNEYARIEELTNEKKHLLRQGSLRKSTREMGHQIMKTIFQQKHEEYNF